MSSVIFYPTASCTSKMKKIDVFSSSKIIATHLLATAPFNFSKKARNQKIAFYRLILGFKGSRISWNKRSPVLWVNLSLWKIVDESALRHLVCIFCCIRKVCAFDSCIHAYTHNLHAFAHRSYSKAKIYTKWRRALSSTIFHSDKLTYKTGERFSWI